MRGVDLGKRVALVDGGPLGGAGIYDGALSSKTFWHLAMDYARAHRNDRGYDGSSLRVSWPALCAEVSEASAQGAHAHVERVGDVFRGWIAAAELRREHGTHAIGEVVHFGEPPEQVSCVAIEHVDQPRVGARVREVERGGWQDDRVLVGVEAQRRGEDPLVL